MTDYVYTLFTHPRRTTPVIIGYLPCDTCGCSTHKFVWVIPHDDNDVNAVCRENSARCPDCYDEEFNNGPQ
jgi:hypothetical protein